MRKHMRTIGIILSILLVLSATACNKNVIDNDHKTITTMKAPKVGNDKVKLKAFLMYSDANRKELYDRYYSQNIKKDLPQFNVEFEVTSGTGYLDKLRIYNSSGYMPDVYWGNNLPISSGNSLDLTEIIKKDGFEARYTNKGALIPWKDGKIYTISAGTDQNYIPVIFYHRDLFKKEGISVPKTMKEFILIGKLLREKDYIPITAPGAWILCETFMQELFVGIDPSFAFNIVAGKARFSDPTGLRAFKEMKEMIDARMFPTNIATLDYSAGMQLFLEKKAAMCFVASWEAAKLGADSDVDFFGVPGTNADTIKNINIWGSAQNGFSVFSHSQNRDAAVKLAEWLVCQDARYFVTEKKNKVSIDVGVDLKNVPALVEKTFDRIAAATSSKTAIMALSGPTDSVFQTDMGKFLTGQITPEAFAEELDENFAKNDLVW